MLKHLIHSTLLLLTLYTKAQENHHKEFQLSEVGILFNYGKQKNFLFQNVDYFYQTRVFKLQFFFPVVDRESWKFILIGQPQIQNINHKLLNKYYLTPDKENYLEKQERFTKQRHITLAGFEVGSQFKFRVYRKLSLETILGLGVAYIDSESERLAKGFTFIENLSLGLSHPIYKSEVYVGTNFGHVSNLDFQLPNDGYNIMGVEVGLRYRIK